MKSILLSFLFLIFFISSSIGQSCTFYDGQNIGTGQGVPLEARTWNNKWYVTKINNANPKQFVVRSANYLTDGGWATTSYASCKYVFEGQNGQWSGMEQPASLSLPASYFHYTFDDGTNLWEELPAITLTSSPTNPTVGTSTTLSATGCSGTVTYFKNGVQLSNNIVSSPALNDQLSAKCTVTKTIQVPQITNTTNATSTATSSSNTITVGAASGGTSSLTSGNCYTIQPKGRTTLLQAMSDGKVQQQTVNNQDNQKWKAESVGASFKFTSISANTAMKVASATGGQQITLSAFESGNTNFLWNLESNNSSYRISLSNGVTWDLEGGGGGLYLQTYGTTAEAFVDYRLWNFISTSCPTTGGGTTITNLNNITGYVGINMNNTGQTLAGIGSFNLAVNGKILANELRVRTSWADFVFEKDFKLKSLSEVENYIKTNGHLPEIPSAKEVEAKGISVGEINAKLLQKIEELTLYIIQQDKRIKQLEKHRK
ncbi:MULTISPECIES: RICIN domain-containing protein [unclassified Arcicella]|uniref:RICIN domain-containing protein n=1 Tax=unclassified Arcicella TaxID=2644986 RepID=UPI0028634B9A|nr:MULTISPECIES: RICIN domain-containing protein [unclassified Arcicella]MDR6560596.1 hypothetical protein [Arcicella sp. BE51]MDR6814679.1 hypothetical protein [Arcicella sp. BE140]MDR6826125.1 hypothetical protein [Arcicella sp. BE139]